MRLEFRILWFENQPRDVRTQVEEIQEHVKAVGFNPSIDMQADAKNLPALARQQKLYDDYDLVVVDYDLGQPGGKQGDHVAREVRRSFGFTDIIFYSGKPTVDLRKLVHELQIDGVYCLARTSLADKLGAHIDQVVRRLSRLEGMRGLSMGTVGKCDDELRAFLSEEHVRSNESRREWMATSLDELVADGVKVSAEKYAECSTFKDRLLSRTVTSFHLQKLTLAVLKGASAFSRERKVLTRYDAQVLSKRNTLGHATEVRGAQGWEVTSKGKPSITSSDFAELRKNMVLHLDNIISLRALNRSKGEQ